MRTAAALAAIFTVLAAACGGTSSSPLPVDLGPRDGASSTDASDPADAGDDTPATGDDGGTLPGSDAGDSSAPVDPIDGAPTRVQCTSKLGQALSATYG